MDLLDPGGQGGNLDRPVVVDRCQPSPTSYQNEWDIKYRDGSTIGLATPKVNRNDILRIFLAAWTKNEDLPDPDMETLFVDQNFGFVDGIQSRSCMGSGGSGT